MLGYSGYSEELSRYDKNIFIITSMFWLYSRVVSTYVLLGFMRESLKNLRIDISG